MKRLGWRAALMQWSDGGDVARASSDGALQRECGGLNHRDRALAGHEVYPRPARRAAAARLAGGGHDHPKRHSHSGHRLGIPRLFPLSDPTVAGLTLATLGAGSAAGLKVTQLAKRADLPLAVALVVVLQLVNLVAVPLWAGRVVTGVSISADNIVKNLLALVLIPLVVGLFIRARYAENATRWQPELGRVANLALGVALVAGIAVNWQTIISLVGSWALVAAFVIVLISLGLGLLMGGKKAPHARRLGSSRACAWARWDSSSSARNWVGLPPISAQRSASPSSTCYSRSP
jgi:hypothetical protein